ncbi:MAG: hypothetical protein EB060_10640 [Proteobacteria bacterium]|nr:hypothetical protein [Pseudomonadota bacterium]
MTVSQNRNGQADYQLRRVPDRKRVDTQSRVEQAGVLGGTGALAGGGFLLSRPTSMKNNPAYAIANERHLARANEVLEAQERIKNFVPTGKKNDGRRLGALKGQASVRNKARQEAGAILDATPRQIKRWNVPRVAAGGIMAGLGTLAVGSALRGRENNQVMPKRQTRVDGEIAPEGSKLDNQMDALQARAGRGFAGKFKGVGTEIDQMRMAQERKNRLARQMQG